jgi:hypothetical protein
MARTITAMNADARGSSLRRKWLMMYDSSRLCGAVWLRCVSYVYSFVRIHTDTYKLVRTHTRTYNTYVCVVCCVLCVVDDVGQFEVVWSCVPAMCVVCVPWFITDDSVTFVYVLCWFMMYDSSRLCGAV